MNRLVQRSAACRNEGPAQWNADRFRHMPDGAMDLEEAARPDLESDGVNLPPADPPPRTTGRPEHCNHEPAPAGLVRSTGYRHPRPDREHSPVPARAVTLHRGRVALNARSSKKPDGYPDVGGPSLDPVMEALGARRPW